MKKKYLHRSKERTSLLREEFHNVIKRIQEFVIEFHFEILHSVMRGLVIHRDEAGII